MSRRVRRARILTNEGRTKPGYQCGDLIAYCDADQTWTVERGDPDTAPAYPVLILTGATRKQALAALRG